MLSTARSLTGADALPAGLLIPGSKYLVHFSVLEFPTFPPFKVLVVIEILSFGNKLFLLNYHVK